MTSIKSSELLSRCVVLDNGDPRDVESPEGYMFMPDWHTNKISGISRLETSVILHKNQTDEELDKAGKYIERNRKRPSKFLGRCVCTVADVESIDSLTVTPQPSKNSQCHANILGWDNDKAQQLLEAEKIAMTATFVPRAS